MAYSVEQENPQLHERIKAILSPTQELLRQTSSAPIGINECINIAYDACVKIADQQQKIDIDKACDAYCMESCGHPRTNCDCMSRMNIQKAMEE